MKTITKKLYEGMFLVDSALAAQDWEGVLDTIRNILKRADAEIISLRKWAERRLAYPIDHKTRGTYILCYFKADGQRIGGIERDVQLSERIMRVLILSAEQRSSKDIEKDTMVQEQLVTAERAGAGDDQAQTQKAGSAAPVERGEVPATEETDTEEKLKN